MADNEQKAQQCVQEARKKLGSSSGWLQNLFGGPSKATDDAIELYLKAGNLFKMAKKWNEAGNAFNEAATLHQNRENRDNKLNAAGHYVDASNCYKKCNPQEAINCLLKVIDIYTDMGRFNIAAKHHMSIAEIYESDMSDIPKAVEHYTKAADYYQCEESNTTANRCLLNVARYAAQLEQYDRAIEIYEKIGQSNLDNNLLKYGAKEHFLRAGLCHLCVDLLNAQIAVKKYEEMSPAFTDSRECKLLKDLMARVEAQDPEGFADVVQDYDSISRLDQWYTTILLRIKNHLVQEEDVR
ncbi:Alpha-soluble NSF attachment protein, partial [Fragariocoptes setiger]